MTRCDRCGKESGNLYCGKCREEIKRKTCNTKSLESDLIPVLYYDKKLKLYAPACSVIECPCNSRGFCSSKITLDTFIMICHDYDGDNCVKQVCG
jgi:hypothetical protein